MQVRQSGADFVSGWAAHGAQLTAAIELFYDRFVVIFVDEAQAQATGCSIDRSVYWIQGLEEQLNCSFTDRLVLAYRDPAGELQQARMADLQEMLANGHLSADTIVFNNLVQTKQAFENEWEVPVAQSWHKQLLPA